MRSYRWLTYALLLVIFFASAGVARFHHPHPQTSPRGMVTAEGGGHTWQDDRSSLSALHAKQVRREVKQRLAGLAARRAARIASSAASRSQERTPSTKTGTASTAAPLSGDWLRLRTCESGNDYTTNTGNGFYGAYQFLPSTFQSQLDHLGIVFSGLPSEAPSWMQDKAAVYLQSNAGWKPWPGCAAKLGLTVG